jgi:hypothetical protein
MQGYAYMCGFAFIFLCCGSVVAGLNAGIVASAVLFILMIVCFVMAGRLTVLTARQAGVYLGLTPHQAKYVPLRIASNFDMWISKRNHPKFPRVTLFD